jgi:hypothetical protein
LAANWQFGWAVSGEAYGTTTSSVGPYAHTVTFFPILPVNGGGTVIIKLAGTQIAADDGNGNIVGAGLTGTVNYVTGATTFTFSSGPSSGQAITINYNASTINTTPSNFDDMAFNIKQVMKQAGWTVNASGDGTGGTYGASSDVITKRGTGVNTFGNVGSWFVIESPDTKHFFLFRRGTAAGTWFVGYCLTAITGGTPSATATPTNALMWGLFGTTGNVTSSNPTGGDVTGAQTVGNCHHNCAADSNSPYGVYSFGFLKNPTTATSGGLCFMIFDSLASGSYQVADVDPFFAYFNGTAASASVPTQGVASINGVLENNIVWQSWPTSFTSNPFTGKDDLLPMWYYGNTSAPVQTYKGQSYYFKWETFTTASRPIATLLDQSSLNDTVLFAQWCLPWNGLAVYTG